MQLSYNGISLQMKLTVTISFCFGKEKYMIELKVKHKMC